MTIIEGLQAAWGTVSRIIAAFMAFLLAVKSGGAGPLFATVLASAAVVVLDFVGRQLAAEEARQRGAQDRLEAQGARGEVQEQAQGHRLEQAPSATYSPWASHPVEEALYREAGVHNGPTIKPVEF